MPEKPEHIGLDNKSTVERDRIDQNREIAGEQTSRIQRFLTKNHQGIYGESDKKKAERRYRNMLEMLLAEDARYAKLYFEVQDTLNKARQAVDRALIDIRQRLEESERILRFLRNNAARLDNGTMVFLSTVDGNVYTEDGRKLSNDETQNIEFSENAPSWEEYKTATKNVDTAKEQKLEVETYQNDVLDRVQKQLNSVDDPPSLEELEELGKRIEQTMPDTVKARYEFISPTALDTTRSSSIAQNVQGKPDLSVPDMNAAFEKVRNNISDLTRDLPKDQPDITLSF